MNEFYKEKAKPEMQKSGIEFFHLSTPKGRVATNSHVHESVEMLYVTEGSFRIRCDGALGKIGVGDLAFFRPNCVHEVHALDGELNSYFVFKVDPSLVFALLPEQAASKYALHLALFEDGAKFLWRSDELKGSDIVSGIDKLASELKNHLPARDIVMRATALSIICAVIRELESQRKESPALPSSVYSYIYKSMRYVNEHYHEDVTAGDMAKLLNMSYSYFSRSFTRLVGMSFREYLNSVRIKKAQRLLITTDKSVTEISLLSGYNNVSHFIQTYKKMKGETPHKHRQV